MAIPRARRTRWRRAEIAVASAHVAAIGALTGWAWLGLPRDMPAIERVVAARWPDVEHLPRADLARRLMHGRDRIVLFDVRQADEYAVSHLAGAVQVDPDTTADEFLARFGAALAGKTAVLYCSVGVRSSRLAVRVQDELGQHGTIEVYNLVGGLFGWHDDARPLVDARGPVDVVHGFGTRWSRLLKRQSFARMSSTP